MLEKTIAKIEAQQKELDEFSPVYQVGEQLKDILRDDPAQAGIVFEDLENPDMSIAKAERKIKEFADKHKKGGASCVPPRIADKIIREFYGLADGKAAPKTGGLIDLADFM